jgi:S-adenosylmethionine decarboxylase
LTAHAQGHLLEGNRGFAMTALARLGMVSELPPSDAQTLADQAPLVIGEEPKDYFVTRDGVKFAGMHVLVDLWGASRLDDPDHIDRALRDGAIAAGATILHGHFHHFSPNGGVSGVLVLAESHISIHTWPERDYAAIDIFMCGACNPYDAIAAIKAAFRPQSVQLAEHKRGLVG